MRQEGNGAMSINEVWIQIQLIKAETEKFSWLLGEELTHKIIETMEERENDIIENLTWFA